MHEFAYKRKIHVANFETGHWDTKQSGKINTINGWMERANFSHFFHSRFFLCVCVEKMKKDYLSNR